MQVMQVRSTTPATAALEWGSATRLAEEDRWRWQALPGRLLPALVVTAICLGALQVGYLLFHTLAEIFSIVIALTAMAVAMTSHRFTRNHYTIHVALAIGWCAALDMIHTLVYPGMRVLPVDGPQWSTQFWIVARFMQAAALLASPLFLRIPVRIGLVNLVYGGSALLATLWIYAGTFPDTYIEGQGLTPFKVYAEYLIIAMLLAAAALLWRERRLMSARLHLSMQAAILMMALSEFAFTRYATEVYGSANQLGHIFKIFAYWFVYLALVQSTLRQPFGALARTAGSFDAMPDPVVVVSTDGIIRQVNRAAVRRSGLPARELAGRHVHALFHTPTVAAADCPVCARIAQGEHDFMVEIDRGAAGGSVECTVAPYWPGDLRYGLVQVVRDITERKELAREREQLLRDLGERIKELRCLYTVARLLERDDLDRVELMQQVVQALPAAFLRPDQVRVAMDGTWGRYGQTEALQSTVALRQPVRVDGQVVAEIVAAYPEDVDLGLAAFLPEEQEMLASLAAHLGEAIRRRESQRQVRRLSYLYTMLSAANRAIVRCTTEEQLLREVHDALVQHGRFPVVFIALSEQGALPLRLVHQFGIDVRHEDELQALLQDRAAELGQRWADLHAGRTLAGALQPQGAHPWQKRQLQAGLRAQAWVPLMREGLVHGVIGLYADRVDDFDTAKVALLDEMAADLAYALNSLATERHRQHAVVRAERSELRFREVFESSPLPMQIHDVDDGTLLAINRAHRDWLGYDLAEIRSVQDWFEKVYADPGERETLRSHWLTAIERVRQSGGVAQSPELSLRGKDGREHIAQGTMTLVGTDAIIGWVDLTEIRRNEAALRASEQHFRTLIEQAVMGIYVRRDGRFLYVNPHFCQMFGWSREELQGQEIWGFVRNDDATVQRIRAAWAALDAGQDVVQYNVSVRRKDGQWRELALQARRILWDGAPADIVVAEDVTERREAEAQIARYVQQLEASMRGTLQAVSNMIDQRDPYTAGHERRVGLIAAAIGAELGWDAKRCEMMELVGLVHDIGKIAVPAEILTKPGRLTDLEMQLMRQHAEVGYQILKDVPFPYPVADIIRQHHERLDGSGYPRGLKGEQILPEARVLAVADVVESIATHRPYRPARGLDAALDELERGRGTLFDPEVIDAFARLLHDKGYVLPQ